MYYSIPHFLFIGSKLANFINLKHLVGIKGELTFDNSQLDGTPRKLLDITKLNASGWKAKASLEYGIKDLARLYGI